MMDTHNELRYPLMIPGRYDKFRGWVYRILKWPYMTTGLMAYGFIFILILLYMGKAPTFKSEMDLVLPGTGNTSNVSLDDVGQVVSQTTTPFSSGFNPRVNYKEMLSSRSVLGRAAETLGLQANKFGKPKVKLTEQTSILNITVTGKSAEQAQNKAWALYNALQAELDNLRTDEVARRDESIRNVLAQYRERTNYARANIVDFQQRSILVSTDQMDKLVASLAQVNEKKMYVQSELSEVSDYIQQLSLSLSVSPSLAGKALILQSDPEFRSYYQELNSASGVLSEYQSRWGDNHPKVITEQERVKVAKASLISRGQEVTGADVSSFFTSFNLDNNPKRAQLFADLIDAFARKEGQAAMYSELERASLHMQDQLKVYSREVAELDRLQREFDMAEAIFTSAAARLEANKADVFASYPVIQMLATPSFAVKQSSPDPIIAIAAGMAGMFFITFALVVLWQRKSIINLILKKD